MKRAEYFQNLRESWESGRISDEAYDAGINNAEYFCDSETDEESDAE